MAEYTMTLAEACKEDPTIFDFEYNPKIMIEGTDLKEYVKAYYWLREINSETIDRFKFYLQRDFVVNAQWLYDKLHAFQEANKLDQLVSNKETQTRDTKQDSTNSSNSTGNANGSSTNNNIDKSYLTPVSGYDKNDVESTRNTSDIVSTNKNQSSYDTNGKDSLIGKETIVIERITDLPMVAYAKYEAGYLNALEVFLKHFDKLFMRIY